MDLVNEPCLIKMDFSPSYVRHEPTGSQQLIRSKISGNGKSRREMRVRNALTSLQWSFSFSCGFPHVATRGLPILVEDFKSCNEILENARILLQA